MLDEVLSPRERDVVARGQLRVDRFQAPEHPEGGTEGAGGVVLVDPMTAAVTQRLTTNSPVTGLASVTGLDLPYVYAAAGRSIVVVALPKPGETGSARISATLKMPGRVRDVAWDRSSLMVHVLGWTPEPSAGTAAAAFPELPAIAGVRLAARSAASARRYIGFSRFSSASPLS